MYKDAIQYLQDNSLAAPIFTGSETAPYCTDSQSFITTGNAIELPMMEYEAESEEVWGYVAFFTDAEGDTQLYVLPGQKVQAFPITTLTKDTDYKLEIRTIGKNQILPVSTAEIYNFILGLELTKGRADLQHQITGEFAALQAKLADVQEPSYVQEVLEGFDLIASLVAGKIAIPAELQKRIIAELTDLQNKLKALPTHIA
ncbi:MAG: hypothetical protein LBD75_00620 [Candidatus Peribacteria bacterium]|jgi:hypothetical protein|nr:hypothetical protein [Candidatus Peribacteria bacterium]